MNIDILRGTLDDIDDISSLNEKYMFYGSAVRPHFEELLQNPDNIALKCTVNGDFAGALTCLKGIALLGNHSELISRIKRLSEGRNIYTGDSVVVKSEYRRLGIAGKLCSGMLEELRNRGAELLLSEIWVYPDGNAPALKTFGSFENHTFLGHFENFYSDLHNLGYTCPVCGVKCACSAIIQLIELAGNEENT